MNMLGVEHALGDHRRVRNGHDHCATKELGERGEHRVADGRAPVLADQMRGLAAAERADQLGDVGCERAPVEESVTRNLGRWVAA